MPPSRHRSVEFQVIGGYMLAFAAVLVAGALTFSTFRSVRTDLRQITDVGLPIISESLELAEQVGSLGALTPLMIEAREPGRQDLIYQTIRDRAKNIRDYIAHLETLGAERRYLRVLRADADAYEQRAQTLRDLVAERNGVEAEKASLSRDLFDLLAQSVSRDPAERPGVLALQRNLGKVIGKAVEIQQAPTPFDHQRLASQVSGYMAGLRVALQEYGEDAVLSDLRNSEQELRRLVAAGALDVRRRELDINGKIDAQIMAFKQAGDKLIYGANTIYRSTRDRVHGVAATTRSNIQEQVPFLIATLFLVLFGLLASFYLIRVRVVRRISRLHQAVLRHTLGERQDFQVDGDDEITRVGTALRELVEAIDQREAQKQRALEQAEAASHSKTRFLAAASHDLRQPLQAATLFLSTLSNLDLKPQHQEIVGKTEDAIASLRFLLDGILDLSKLDAGLVTVKTEVFQSAVLFQRLASEFSQLAAHKGLRFKVVAPSVLLRGDPRLLETVLRNILDNAIKYTDQGGILFGGHRRGANLRIDVLDTGRGIAPEVQSRIFEEFYQVGNQERDRRKGLGLGLAIVRRMTDLLGSTLEIDSRPGRGSRFSIAMPLVVNRPLPRPVSLSPQAFGRRSKILLIEDDVQVREATEALLRAWGHAVIADCCADPNSPGFAPLIDALDGPPDLLIMDFRLPEERTGVQAIQALRQVFNRAIPAIIVTGETSPQRLTEIDGTGLPVLYKPIDPHQLRQAILEAEKFSQ
ncbi:hypothetical protein JCM17960_30140 [Magnetospira thiophila]